MSKEIDDNQQEVSRGRLADIDLSSDMIISSAAFADLIRRVENLESYLTGKDDPAWGPCTRCGYGPFRRPRRPICCPKCHSAYWDREPKNVSARKPGDPPARSWTNRGNGRRAETRPSRPASIKRPPVALPPELRPPGDELIPPPPRAVATEDVQATLERTGWATVPRTLSEQLAERTSSTPRVAELADAPSGEHLPNEGADRDGEGQPMANGPSIVGSNPTPWTTTHVVPMPDEIVERVLSGEEVGYEDIKQARVGVDEGIGDARLPTQRSDAEGQLPDNGNQRPTDPALQAKKDSFFADAIQAGLVSPVVEGEATKDEAPFVAPGMAAEIDAKKKDDPFWK